jgi:hypothetical protein
MKGKTSKAKRQQDASPCRQELPSCHWGETLPMLPCIDDELLDRVWSRLSPQRLSDTQIAMLRASLQEMLGTERPASKRAD